MTSTVQATNYDEVKAITLEDVRTICEAAKGDALRILIGIFDALGVTQTCDQARTISVTKRAILKARVRTTVRRGYEPQFVGGTNRSSQQVRTTVRSLPSGTVPAIARAQKEYPSDILSRSEDSRLVDIPVSSSNTEQAAIAPAASKNERERIVALSKTASELNIPDKAFQNSIATFSVDIAAQALARVFSRVQSGEKIRNPAVIHTRVCEDMHREATTGHLANASLADDEGYWRRKAALEGRTFMGKG